MTVVGGIEKAVNILYNESINRDYSISEFRVSEVVSEVCENSNNDIYLAVAEALENKGVFIECNFDGLSEDGLSDYLRIMGSMPMLNKDLTFQYAKKAFSGDSEAKKILAERNLRLVVSIAKRYQGRGVPFEDLIQEGNIGLLIGIDKFDPYKGFMFSTYVTYWIRQSVIRAVEDKGRSIRVPTHMMEKIVKVNEFTKSYMEDFSTDPTYEDISKGVNIPADKVKEILEIPEASVSLDAPVGEEGSFVYSFIPDNKVDVEGSVLKNILSEEVQEALKILPERERELIIARWGLNGTGEKKTLKECSRSLGVTTERARQIEKKAFRKLKNSAESRHLINYV